MIQPFKVLREAIRAVPAVRYALGVAGIAAVVAIVAAFRLDFKVAVFGTLVTFGFMVALVIFAKLTTVAPKHFLKPVLVMMWAFLVLVVASASLLFSAVFFQWPPAFHQWLFKGKGTAITPSAEIRASVLQGAQMQLETGDYAGAWKQLEEALPASPNDPKGLRLQAQIAMGWLRNIRGGDGPQPLSKIVDRVLPSLFKAVSSAKGVWAADLRAHIGWSYFLKQREATAEAEVVADHFKQALELDSQNVYGHAMWGFWILWQRGKLDEANPHFEAALKSGREKPYVRNLHLSALLNTRSKEHALELVRRANDIRQNSEAIEQDQRERIVSRVYLEHWQDILADVSSSKPILPPSEYLATLNWLGAGSDKLVVFRGFFTARVTEVTGDYATALGLYRSLKLSKGPYYDTLEREIDRGIARCDRPGAMKVPATLRDLKNPSADVRLTAIALLAGLNSPPQELAPALVESLRDTDARVRMSAARVLGQLRNDVKTVIPALINAFQDENQEVRDSALEAAVVLGPAAAPDLVAALKNPHERIRRKATDALQQFGAEAKAVVPALVELLKAENTEIREAAIDVLQEIGPDASPAVPALRQVLSENSPRNLKLGAAYALGKIGPAAKDAVPELVKALEAKDEVNDFLRSNAADALGEIGPDAKAAVPALIATLENDDVRSPTCAAFALGSIGADAKAAIPPLIQAMKQAESKKNQAQALGQIAESLQKREDVSAIPLLREALAALEDANFEPKILRPVREALESLKEIQQSKK